MKNTNKSSGLVESFSYPHPSTQIHKLDYDRDNALFNKILDHIKRLTRAPKWKDFRRPASFAPSTGWQVPLPLSQIAPNANEAMWFYVELIFVTFDLIYEAKAEAIEEVIRQSRIPTYFIIAKDFSWAIAKNYRDEFFVDGEIMEGNFRKLNNASSS